MLPGYRITRVKRVLLCAGVVFLSFAAWASDGGQSSPTWESIATGLVGVLSLIIGAYARGLERRVFSMESGLKGLNDKVLGDYHDATDTERAIAQALKPIELVLGHLQSEIAAVHARLDKLAVPQATRGRT